MKRAGKLFLIVILVLSMFWTSTGTSNVMGVFAENSAEIQSVKEDKEAKAGVEGKDSDIKYSSFENNAGNDLKKRRDNNARSFNRS